MKMSKKVDLEEMFSPTRFVLINEELFYESPTRGLIKVLELKIYPNYGDVELVQCFDGEDIHAIMRMIGSDYGKEAIEKSETHIIYQARGDVVQFDLEDGRTIFMDLGADPGGYLRKLVNKVTGLYPIGEDIK